MKTLILVGLIVGFSNVVFAQSMPMSTTSGNGAIPSGPAGGNVSLPSGTAGGNVSLPSGTAGGNVMMPFDNNAAGAQLKCRCECQGATKTAVTEEACNTGDFFYDIPAVSPNLCKELNNQTITCPGGWRKYNGTCQQFNNTTANLKNCNAIVN